MMARSERHHEVPIWLSKHFCWDCDERLWMGFKETREVRLVGVRDAFVKKKCEHKDQLSESTRWHVSAGEVRFRREDS